MTTPAGDYEYRGAKALYWDLLRGDTSSWEDRPFYLAIIANGGEPVLDVGCGTGRLLLDFLGLGIHIQGVDNSPEMLEACRQKAHRLGLQPVLFQQQMESLELPSVYRTIMVPSSSFQLIVDRAAATVAMHRFFQHLEPGGSLVMPFMLLWERRTNYGRQPADWKMLAESTRPEDGALVRRWARSTFDLTNQLEHTEDRYELIQAGQVVSTEHQTRSPATRWYTQAQVVDLYREAGFVDIHLARGFTDAPATEADTIFSAVGRHP